MGCYEWSPRPGTVIFVRQLSFPSASVQREKHLHAVFIYIRGKARCAKVCVKMTKRERYLQALRNRPVDELVWAPNFDYWLYVNSAEGTLPEKYRGMSRNDIVRTIGGYIWNRAGGIRILRDPSITERWETVGDQSFHTITTPVGQVREIYTSTKSEGSNRAPSHTEHFIKNREDLRIMTYIVEGSHCEFDPAPTAKALAETGNDGVVLNSFFCVPFIQFAKTDAGYVTGFYLWADHKEDVDRLITAYARLFLEGYSLIASGPADIIATGDNMDGVMISPPIFEEYAIPFYQQAKEIASRHGKILEGHWCGRTQSLLHLVPGCGLDVVEAIVTKPMADISLAEALDRLGGKVVLQGGIPSVPVCEQGGTREDFERYIEEAILPIRGRKGFILGMSDNVPPNADFWRVERVAQLLGEKRNNGREHIAKEEM